MEVDPKTLGKAGLAALAAGSIYALHRRKKKIKQLEKWGLSSEEQKEKERRDKDVIGDLTDFGTDFGFRKKFKR